MAKWQIETTSGNYEVETEGDTQPTEAQLQTHLSSLTQPTAPASVVPPRPDRTVLEEAGSGWMEGINRGQAGVAGAVRWLGKAVGSEDLSAWGAKEAEFQNKEADQYASKYQTTDDIHGVSDTLKYAAHAIPSSIAQMLPAIGAGAAAIAASVAPTPAALIATAAGAIPATGRIFNTQAETGDTDLLSSAVGGVASSALDQLVPGGIVTKALKPVAGAAIKTGAKAFGTTLAKTMATEGATETAQEIIERGANKYANPNKVDMMSSEALKSYKEAGIAGALLGGVMGVPSHGIDMMNARRSKPTETVSTTTAEALPPIMANPADTSTTIYNPASSVNQDSLNAMAQTETLDALKAGDTVRQPAPMSLSKVIVEAGIEKGDSLTLLVKQGDHETEDVFTHEGFTPDGNLILKDGHTFILDLKGDPQIVRVKKINNAEIDAVQDARAEAIDAQLGQGAAINLMSKASEKAKNEQAKLDERKATEIRRLHKEHEAAVTKSQLPIHLANEAEAKRIDAEYAQVQKEIADDTKRLADYQAYYEKENNRLGLEIDSANAKLQAKRDEQTVKYNEARQAEIEADTKRLAKALIFRQAGYDKIGKEIEQLTASRDAKKASQALIATKKLASANEELSKIMGRPVSSAEIKAFMVDKANKTHGKWKDFARREQNEQLYQQTQQEIARQRQATFPAGLVSDTKYIPSFRQEETHAERTDKRMAAEESQSGDEFSRRIKEIDDRVAARLASEAQAKVDASNREAQTKIFEQEALKTKQLAEKEEKIAKKLAEKEDAKAKNPVLQETLLAEKERADMKAEGYAVEHLREKINVHINENKDGEAEITTVNTGELLATASSRRKAIVLAKRYLNAHPKTVSDESAARKIKYAQPTNQPSTPTATAEPVETESMTPEIPVKGVEGGHGIETKKPELPTAETKQEEKPQTTVQRKQAEKTAKDKIEKPVVETKGTSKQPAPKKTTVQVKQEAKGKKQLKATASSVQNIVVVKSDVLDKRGRAKKGVYEYILENVTDPLLIKHLKVNNINKYKGRETSYRVISSKTDLFDDLLRQAKREALDINPVKKAPVPTHTDVHYDNDTLDAIAQHLMDNTDFSSNHAYFDTRKIVDAITVIKAGNTKTTIRRASLFKDIVDENPNLVTDYHKKMSEPIASTKPPLTSEGKPPPTGQEYVSEYIAKHNLERGDEVLVKLPDGTKDAFKIEKFSKTDDGATLIHLRDSMEIIVDLDNPRNPSFFSHGKQTFEIIGHKKAEDVTAPEAESDTLVEDETFIENEEPESFLSESFLKNEATPTKPKQKPEDRGMFGYQGGLEGKATPNVKGGEKSSPLLDAEQDAKQRAEDADMGNRQGELPVEDTDSSYNMSSITTDKRQVTHLEQMREVTNTLEKLFAKLFPNFIEAKVVDSLSLGAEDPDALRTGLRKYLPPDATDADLDLAIKKFMNDKPQLLGKTLREDHYMEHIIKVSAQSPNATHTAHHELMHVIYNISSPEIQAKLLKPFGGNIEKLADHYADYATGKGKFEGLTLVSADGKRTFIPKMIRDIWDRVLAFIHDLHTELNKLGYGKPADLQKQLLTFRNFHKEFYQTIDSGRIKEYFEKEYTNKKGKSSKGGDVSYSIAKDRVADEIGVIRTIGEDKQPKGWKDRARDFADGAYFASVDGALYINKTTASADKQTKSNVYSQAGSQAVNLVRNISSTVSEILSGKNGLYDLSTGKPIANTKSLIQVYAPFKGDKKMAYYWHEWMTARRTLKLKDSRDTKFKSSPEQQAVAINNMAKIEAAYKDKLTVFNDVAKDMLAFTDHQLKVALDHDIISKEVYSAIKDDPAHDYYISLKRVVDKAQGKKTAYLIQGSERDVQDPMKSIVENVTNLTAAVRYQQLNKTVVSALDALNESPLLPTEETGKSTVTVYKDGKKLRYEADPLIVKSISALHPREHNTFHKWLSMPAKMLRFGTILKPTFAIKNVLRDQTMGMITTEGYRLTDYYKGIKAILNDDTVYNEAKFNGAMSEMSQSYGKLDVKELHEKMLKGEGGKLFTWNHPFKSVIESMEYLNTLSEHGTRLGAYMKAVESGMSPQAAAISAQEISTNFTVHGGNEAFLDYISLMPFVNANIQGMDRFIRLFTTKDKEARNRAYVATAVMATASMSLYALIQNLDDEHKDMYNNTTDLQKNMSWFIPVPMSMGGFIKLPKPYEIGLIFASLPERMLDIMHRDDPTAFKNWLKQMESVAPDVLPTFLKPFYENEANHNFFTNRAIEDAHDLTLPTGMRSHTDTPSVLTTFGAWTGMSPLKMQNWAKGWYGGVGSLGLEAGSAVLDVFPSSSRTPQVDRPLTETLGLQSILPSKTIGSNSKPVDDFYTTLKDSMEAKNGLKALIAARDYQGAREFRANNQIALKLVDVMDEGRKQLADLNKQIRTIQDSPTLNSNLKRTRIERLKAMQTKIAERYMRVVKKYD